LRGGEAIGRRAAESRARRSGAPLLIGGGYMPTALREDIVEAIGEPPIDATAQVWTLMRRTTKYEQLAMYNTGVALGVATDANATACENGAGVTEAILAGGKAAHDRRAHAVQPEWRAHATTIHCADRTAGGSAPGLRGGAAVQLLGRRFRLDIDQTAARLRQGPRPAAARARGDQARRRPGRRGEARRHGHGTLSPPPGDRGRAREPD